MSCSITSLANAGTPKGEKKEAYNVSVKLHAHAEHLFRQYRCVDMGWACFTSLQKHISLFGLSERSREREGERLWSLYAFKECAEGNSTQAGMYWTNMQHYFIFIYFFAWDSFLLSKLWPLEILHRSASEIKAGNGIFTHRFSFTITVHRFWETIASSSNNNW